MKKVALLGLFLAALTGCVTMTFRRGASPEAMAEDEEACRGSASSPAAYVQCMRERGWFVVDAGSTASEDTRESELDGVENPGTAQDPGRGDEVHPVPGVESASVKRPPARAPDVHGSDQPNDGPPLPAASGAETERVVEGAEETEVDPLDRVSVGSWWKLGGSPDDLDRAMAACTSELSPEHRPEPGARVVTAGLRSCLGEKGWYAFGTRAAP